MDDLRQLALSLLDSHGYRLLRLLARLTLRHDVAEDLFQELFMNLVQSPKWSQVADPTGYVFGMAIKLACRWRTAQRKVPGAQVPEDQAASAETALEGLIHREEMDRVVQALADLPETTRHCLVLRYLEEETPESIGQRVGKSAHHVRSICSKGLAALRRRLAAKASTDEEEKMTHG